MLHCNALDHIATHSMSTHCMTWSAQASAGKLCIPISLGLQRTGAYCNALHVPISLGCRACLSKYAATHCTTMQHTATHRTTPHHTATPYCDILHCNTLPHTATHCLRSLGGRACLPPSIAQVNICHFVHHRVTFSCSCCI